MKFFIRQINTILFAAMILINILANILPLGGNTTGQISAEYPTLFTPAPFTFMIWSVIYLILGICILTQFLFRKKASEPSRMQEKIGIWFLFSCLMNIFWIFSWHFHQITLSVIFMIGLLLSLIFINLRLDQLQNLSFWEELSLYGFQLYLGWITAASIANISVLLVKQNWDGFGLSPQFWTILIVTIGAIIGILFILFGKRYYATVAVIWAYFGIFVRHAYYDTAGASVITISIIVIAIFAMLGAIVFSLPPKLGINYGKQEFYERRR